MDVCVSKNWDIVGPANGFDTYHMFAAKPLPEAIPTYRL